MEETKEQKIKRISDTLNSETKKLTNSISNWHNHLNTVSKFYKYSFTDQILIAAQNPNAALCAEYKMWQNNFNRNVRQGAKGISLLYEENGKKKLRHVFDISSTKKSSKARDIKVWEPKSDYLSVISKNIAEKNDINFDTIINKNAENNNSTNEVNFINVIKARIDTLLNDKSNKYVSDIINHKKGTPLEEFDDSDIEAMFKNIVKYSTRYITVTRCGFDVGFRENYFKDIDKFNSNETITQLGKAVSDISETMLREIEREVKTIDKETERSGNYERHLLTGSDGREIRTDNEGNQIGQNSDRQESDNNNAGGQGISEIYGGGRTDIRFGRGDISVSSADGNRRGGRIRDGNVGSKEIGIPEERETGNIRNSDDKRTLGTSDTDGQSGLRNGGQTDRGNDENGGSDGRTQNDQSNGMGRQNEQHQKQSERDNLQRTDLRLENIEEKAEDINSPAFSFARKSDLSKISSINDLIAQAKKLYDELPNNLKVNDIETLLNQTENTLINTLNRLENETSTEKKTDTEKTESKPNIIGNTTFKYISKKTYRRLDTETALKAADEFEKENIKYSGKYNDDNTITLTFSGSDKEKCDNIIKTIHNANSFTPEQLETVRGQQLNRVGSEYTIPEHDSMRIKENKFFWNSQNIGGNALDFCMTYYNMDFERAVTELLAFNGHSIDLNNKANMRSDVKKPSESEITANNSVQNEHNPFPNELTNNKNKVTEYLHKIRGISDETINDFLIKDKIAQDIKGNAVFKIFDKDGNISGAEISGTSPKRYKQTTEQNGNGFSFYSGNGTPKVAIFFESAIDLMSFYDMNKETAKDFLLVSMAGLKDKVVLKTIEDYGLDKDNCLISSDYDEAGKNFADKMKKEYGITSFNLFNEDFEEYGAKDWNDLLKAKNEEKSNGKDEPSKEDNFGIPQNIIEELMKIGSNIEDSKFRIKNIYKNISDKKERVSALKKEYGTFGGMASPNNEAGKINSYDFTSKGISVGWNDEDGARNGLITWTTVEKEIEKLINSDNYITADERNKYDRKNFIKAKINLLKEGDTFTIGNDNYTFLSKDSGRLRVIPQNLKAEYHFSVNNLSTHKSEYFIHDFTLERNDFEISTKKDILPLYKDSFKNAGNKGEVDLWLENHRENIRCKNYISNNYGKFHNNDIFSSNDFADSLLKEFSIERIIYVAARNVNDYDGRYSQKSKEESKKYRFADQKEENDPTREYIYNVHPTLANALFETLIDRKRELEIQKTEIQETAANKENDSKKNKSSIHFGMLGNGITVYDISKTDKITNDYPTVAHISDEGNINYYNNNLKAEDIALIEKQAERQKEEFTENWNKLSITDKYSKIFDEANITQLTAITKEKLSMEEKVKKYEHSVIFKDEPFPDINTENIIDVNNSKTDTKIVLSVDFTENSHLYDFLTNDNIDNSNLSFALANAIFEYLDEKASAEYEFGYYKTYFTFRTFVNGK